MILVIDNYDSFTFNLVHRLGELGAECVVHRNDALSAEAALALRPDAIVLSPGPGRPEETGICTDVIRQAEVPLLGVCLGHQAIGMVFGATIHRAPAPVHGKATPVRHAGDDLFAGLPDPLLVARYHSLVVDPRTLPDSLIPTAWSDGLLMAMRHESRPLWGVQFHPESIATPQGIDLLANFLRLARLPVARLAA